MISSSTNTSPIPGGYPTLLGFVSVVYPGTIVLTNTPCSRLFAPGVSEKYIGRLHSGDKRLKGKL